MEKLKSFLKRKDIVISLRRYGINAMGAMAQGLFCSLLIGTIVNTLGAQFHISFLTIPVVVINDVAYTVGSLATVMSGPAMAVAIGYALHCPPLVLFSLITVGFASNALGGAGGPLAVLFIAIITAEIGKAVSNETKIDILLTPLVTIGIGVALSAWWSLGLTGIAGGAAVAGCCAQMVGFAVTSFPENRWSGLVSQGIGTSMLQMGNIVKNPKIWIAPILTSAITGPIATCLFRLEMNGAPVSSGMGTCGFVGQIGVYTGWMNDIAQGTKASVTANDWIGLLLISFLLPAIICPLINLVLKKIGWVKTGDMTLS